MFFVVLDWNNRRYWSWQSGFVGKANRKRSWYSIWQGDRQLYGYSVSYFMV